MVGTQGLKYAEGDTIGSDSKLRHDIIPEIPVQGIVVSKMSEELTDHAPLLARGTWGHALFLDAFLEKRVNPISELARTPLARHSSFLCPRYF